MDAEERERVGELLEEAFGAVEDVTPDPSQPLHLLLPRLELPEPWQPSTARGLTIWEGWPDTRPRFLIDEEIVGESGKPPRSNSSVFAAGEAWRQFSFAFPWAGSDPVRAIQLWLERFTVERD